MTPTTARFLVLAFTAATLFDSGCGGGSSPDVVAIHLVDEFNASAVSGAGKAPEAKPAWLWDFSSPEDASALGWKAAKGVAGLTQEGGVLRGRTTAEDAILWVPFSRPTDPNDRIHHFEVRMRVDKAGKAGAYTIPAAANPAAETPAGWFARQDVEPSDAAKVVRIQPGGAFDTVIQDVLAINPIDQAGAEFAIESVRIVSQNEHRAETPTGVSWEGMNHVYRESIATHAPEAFTLDLDVPSNAWLDLNVAAAFPGALTFRVESVSGDDGKVLLERTLTTAQQWEAAPVELAGLQGATKLRFSLMSGVEGALGFWGSPTIRVHDAAPRTARNPGEELGGTTAPKGVILVVLDTLRRDRLSFYGHDRENSPNLARMAEQGALFEDNVSQATWTKVSVTSLFTSLYPTSHRVHLISDRVSAQADTLAEIYRKAGYATVSFPTNGFAGRSTNLHQGYEELHESPAFDDPTYHAKTAREAVNRAVGWLDRHADTPFFMYLHVVDPHSPFEPRPPYNATWADPAKREERMAEWEEIKKHIKSPFFKGQAVANRADVVAAGVDPEVYLNYQKDWYDGSILGMDAEIGRLIERLQFLGLRDDVVLAVVGDHGEEFHEHGRMFHGQTAYGELANVPLLFYGPGRVPAGVKVAETVRTIDVMPTLLALSGLETPEDAQGQSLLSLMSANGAGSWQPRPAVTEKPPEAPEDPDDPNDPGLFESYGLVFDGWKMIHNVTRPAGKAEYELFDHRKDPLNLQNVADQHADVVEKLKTELETWRRMVQEGMLPKGEAATEGMAPEELDRLRTLGYI